MMTVKFRILALAVILAGGSTALGGVTVTPIDDKPAAPPSTQPGGGAGGQAGSGATTDQVKSLMDEGKYREALKLIFQVVDARGADRTQLLTMRGECQLQIHENSSAVTTLQQAAREAMAANNTVAGGDAAAFATLIQKSSPKNLYVPVNSPEKSPIDILDRNKRKSAYEALFTDIQVVLDAKVHTAAANGSLPPFMEVARDIPAMRGVEHISTEGTKKTDKFAKDAANAAAKVISTTLTEFDAKIAVIEKAADHVQYTNQAYGNTREIHRTGLSADTVRTLEDIETTCGRIPGALKELTQAFKAPEVFSQLNSRAVGVGARARDVRTKDYTVQ